SPVTAATSLLAYASLAYASSADPTGIATVPVATFVASAVNPFDTPKVAVVDSYQLNGPAGSVATSPNGKRVYVLTGSSMQVINTTNDQVTSVSIPSGAVDVAAAGSYVVVAANDAAQNNGGTMTVINATTNRVVRTVPVPVGDTLTNVALSSDGRTAY